VSDPNNDTGTDDDWNIVESKSYPYLNSVTPANQIPGDQITITSQAKQLKLGEKSSVYTLELQGPNNTAKNATADITVNLSSDSASYQFQNVLGDNITSVTISSGSSSTVFYYLDNTVASSGNPTITVSDNAGNILGDSQAQLGVLELTSTISSPTNSSHHNTNITFSGTASATPTTLSQVDLLIYDQTADSYWNGTDWTGTSSSWQTVTGTDTWTYSALDLADWTTGHTYTIQSRATDNSANVETPGTATKFHFPAHITTCSELQAINASTTSKSLTYVLDNDLTCGSFSSIGTFTGNFDGQGYEIRNLSTYRGLFSAVNNPNTVIQNVGLVNTSVSTDGDGGGGSLVGNLANAALIKNCYSLNNNISGRNNLGGLIAYNYGVRVENCFAEGTVSSGGWQTGAGYKGGLVARDYGGTYINCYTAGAVGGKAPNGTFIAETNGATTIINSYSIGSGGGFIGSGTGICSNSYYLGSGTYCDGGVVGKTTEEMQTATTFQPEWDFVGDGEDDIWNIQEGKSYPYLEGVTKHGDIFGDQIIITSESQRFSLGEKSEVITVQLQNLYNDAKNATSNITVDLESTSTNYQFQDVSGNVITTVTIPSGSSSASFYYVDNVYTNSGSPTITVSDSADNVMGDSQAQLGVLELVAPISSPTEGSKFNTNITFSGTATANPNTLSVVELLIYDQTAGTYWNGTDWTGTSSSWQTVTGTDTWTYSGLTLSDWVTEHDYTVQSRATDDLGNIGSPGTAVNFSFDISPPEVSSITSTPSSGEYRFSDTIEVSANFDELVTSTTGLTLTLDTGGTVTIPAWATAVDTVSETYTVGSGENSDDLTITGITGTIIDEYTNEAINPDHTASNLDANSSVIIDNIAPTSAITTPNGVIIEYSSMPEISGTSSDANTIQQVKITIQNTTTGNYWNGTDWQAAEFWLSATGMTSWAYDSSGVVWGVDSEYLIKSKAFDQAGNEESPSAGTTFEFVNSAPTITINSVTKNTNEVLINYDVDDLESSETTISLIYDSNSTLVSDLDNSSVASIQVTDSSNFPTSGTILLQHGTGIETRYEFLDYTSLSGNYLEGITRSTNNTLPYSHSTETTVYLKAQTITGGGTVANGAGKTLTWDSDPDTNLYNATQTLAVVSNDGASANKIGVGLSSPFEFDSITPTINTTNISALTDPAQLTFSVTDDTALEMMISLSDTFSGATWEAYSPNPTISLESNPDTVYVKFRDSQENTTADQILTTPDTPQSLMIQDVSSIAQDKWRLYTSWQIVSEPTPGFEAYRIYRSATEDGTYIYQGSTASEDISVDYYADTVLENDEYYYKIATEDSNGNISYLSDFVWGIANAVQDAGEGGGGDTGDSTAPTIDSGPTVTNTTNNSATITWTTDEEADSFIEYGTTTEYGKVFGNSTTGTSHSVTLENLSGGVTYHYRVRTRDLAGNLTLSADQTFTTEAGGDTTPPVISVVNSGTPNPTSTTVTWTTDEEANSLVDFGTT